MFVNMFYHLFNVLFLHFPDHQKLLLTCAIVMWDVVAHWLS